MPIYRKVPVIFSDIFGTQNSIYNVKFEINTLINIFI